MPRWAKWAITVVILMLVAAMFAGWAMSRRGFSARDEPSAVETFLARTMRNLATPTAVREMRNPIPGTSGNVRAGLEHFADHCAVCHANNGSGDTMFGRNLYPKPPDLRKNQTQGLSDGEIYSIIQNGIRLTGMPAFGEANRTDDAGTWQLVHFIRHLPQLTPEEEAEMKRLNPAPPASSDDDDFLSGEDTDHGKDAPAKGHTHVQGEKK